MYTRPLIARASFLTLWGFGSLLATSTAHSQTVSEATSTPPADTDVEPPAEEGPARGAFFSLMTGFAIGAATDEDGVSQGSFTGSSFTLRFGEEIVEWGLVGFEIGGTFGNGEGYSASLGGLLLHGGLRPLPASTPELLLIGGVGLGGGGLTAEAEGDPTGSGGGTMYMFGALYEFDVSGPDREGLTLAPSLRLNWTPPQSGSDVTLSSVSLGIEAVWYGGE
ncbi:MAG: hypothetical protein ACE366_29505 [Bradymonadia bacterium]